MSAIALAFNHDNLGVAGQDDLVRFVIDRQSIVQPRAVKPPNAPFVGTRLGVEHDDTRVQAAGPTPKVDASQRQRFTSRILPPYMRRSPKVAEVLPVLYLRGLSTGDFREALPILLGDDAAGLSATNIARLTAMWEEDDRRFRQRDLADRDSVYVWVDGIHFNIRLEDDRLCTLVIIGVRPEGTKELVALEDGYRESTDSWATVLRDLRRRGLRASGGRDWRWRAGLLGGRARRVARDPSVP